MRTAKTLRLMLAILIVTTAASGLANRYVSAGGPLAPAGIPGEVYYAPYPLTINLTEDMTQWGGVPMVTVITGPSLSSDPAEDSALTFAAAADDQNLYVYIHVVDKNIIAGQHGANYWNEDSVEYFLNTSGQIDRNAYAAAVAQINLTPADLSQTNSDKPTITGVQGSTTSTRAHFWKTSDGYSVVAETLLNGAPFNLKPAHGAAIGFQVQANGASQQDRNVKLIWSDRDKGDLSWQNPAVFGQLVFFKVGSTDIPEPVARQESSAVTAVQIAWPDVVKATWAGYKKRNIFCGPDCNGAFGLVHDPSADYKSVSEGVGYGLLMAALMNDQHTFDGIYNAAERILREPNGLYNWKADKSGAVIGLSAATDADQDTALALIFAQQQVDSGGWKQHAVHPYGQRANELIDALYQYTVYQGKYLTPGDQWQGNGIKITNPSYFAPAWYRIYDEFQNKTRWQPVIDQLYTSLFANKGAALGLAPDWMAADGSSALDFCKQISMAADNCKYAMTYDAIRVPWRIGLDCLWFNEARACEWSQRTAKFLDSLKNPATDARMFDMDGKPVVTYQDELMVGMWLVAAMAAKDDALQAKLTERLGEFTKQAISAGYWGMTPDDAKYYFSQSLAWFGGAMLSGDFRNLYRNQLIIELIRPIGGKASRINVLPGLTAYLSPRYEDCSFNVEYRYLELYRARPGYSGSLVAWVSF